MSDISAELSHGWRQEATGQLEVAERIYRDIVRKDARCPEGWFRLGIVSLKLGMIPAAIEGFQQSLTLNHKESDAWNLIGVALAMQGRQNEAETVFQKSIELNPNFADAHANLARAQRELGRLEAAFNSLQQALALDPKNVAALLNLGGIFQVIGRPDEAISCFRNVLELQPKNPDALKDLVELLAQQQRRNPTMQTNKSEAGFASSPEDLKLCLGWMLTHQKNYIEACAAFQNAIDLSPRMIGAYVGLGNCQLALNQIEAASVTLVKAQSLDPEDLDVLLTLGSMHVANGEFLEAHACYQKVIAISPDCASAYIGMGGRHTASGNLEKAETCYRKAVELDPTSQQACNCLAGAAERNGRIGDSVKYALRALEHGPPTAESRSQRAMLRLMLGQWTQGLEEYESRWENPDRKVRTFPAPLWDGQAFPERTLLLYCEQGLGDSIQFCRFAHMARDLGGRVVLECQAPLIPLLSTCDGIDQLVAFGSQLPDYHCQAPLMSLPRIFGMTPLTVPNRVPYLAVDEPRTQKWREELSAIEAFKVGIVWRGSPTNKLEKDRSIPLELFEPIAKLDGVQLISLQKKGCLPEIEAVSDRFRVIDLGSQMDLDGGAFLDTAAAMKSLDLVISIDSSPAHVAGAFGVPVWVALTQIADWRWLLERDDTIWYPTMRLFRQSNRRDWRGVIERMVQELESELSRRYSFQADGA